MNWFSSLHFVQCTETIMSQHAHARARSHTLVHYYDEMKVTKSEFLAPVFLHRLFVVEWLDEFKVCMESELDIMFKSD